MRHCDYFGRSASPGGGQRIFRSDKGTEAIVARITAVTGLEPNFVTYTLPGVANAFATIVDGSRLILFDPIFFADIEFDTRTAWSRAAILAHEIGHHLLGHTLDDEGSRPGQELAADRYSGFVLRRMGASIEEASSALALIADPAGSSTHPPRDERLAAVASGWEQARRLEVGPTYRARCVFHGDPRLFLVTDADDVVTPNAAGQPVLAGRRVATTEPGVRWMIQVATGVFKVDVSGVIWGQLNGRPHPVGYLTSP